jgi:Na+-translocating ferredoxin:NAD+ oxidoreductase RnfE subunit
LISLLRKVIPDKVRIPAYIVVIATFVTIVDLFMNAYLPDLHQVLGLFIPLIVVNCIVLGGPKPLPARTPSFPPSWMGWAWFRLHLALTVWVQCGSFWDLVRSSATNWRRTGQPPLVLCPCRPALSSLWGF